MTFTEPQRDANSQFPPKATDGVATAKQVAEFLHISPGSLAQDRYLGKGIPFVRIGKRVRYRWSDVEKFLADNTVRGGDAA